MENRAPAWYLGATSVMTFEYQGNLVKPAGYAGTKILRKIRIAPLRGGQRYPGGGQRKRGGRTNRRLMEYAYPHTPVIVFYQ